MCVGVGGVVAITFKKASLDFKTFGVAGRSAL